MCHNKDLEKRRGTLRVEWLRVAAAEDIRIQRPHLSGNRKSVKFGEGMLQNIATHGGERKRRGKTRRLYTSTST